MTVATTHMDHTAAVLRCYATKSAEAAIVRRLLALALVLEGHKCEDAARAAGSPKREAFAAGIGKPLCDWVHRYNADGLTTLGVRHGGGTPPRLSPEQEAEVADWLRNGPDVEVGEQQGSR